jgi:hypothetical protein
LLPQKYLNRLKPALALALAFQLAACSVTSNVVSSTSSSQPQVGKHLSHVGKVQWSYFWGLVPADNLPAGCSDGSDVSKVRTVTKPGFIVISFLTLGIVVPQQMEWDCAQMVREPGTLGH